MALEEAGSFMAVLAIDTTHIPGRKPTRIIFDMLYYLLFYLVVFFIVILIDGVSNKRFSSFKISIFSLSASVFLLLSWNFLLGPILMEESYGGVSAILSSVLSIGILFLFSMILCVLHYSFIRMVKYKNK